MTSTKMQISLDFFNPAIAEATRQTDQRVGQYLHGALQLGKVQSRKEDLDKLYEKDGKEAVDFFLSIFELI